MTSPRAGAQPFPVPGSSFRWVGNRIEVTFTGSSQLRYQLEISEDGGGSWHRSSPWRAGSTTPTTLTSEPFATPTARHYRLVVQPAKSARPSPPDAQINHILISGQSNAIGTSDSSYQPLSTRQPFRNVMFNGFTKRRYYNNEGVLAYSDYFASGLRAPHCVLSQSLHHPLIDNVPWLVRDSEYYRSEEVIRGFVPLVEATEPLLCCPVVECPVFETLASSIANTLTSRRGARFLASIHGVGSLSIAELNRSARQDADHAIDLASVHPALSGWASAAYANGMYQVRRAAQIAAGQNLSYKVAAVIWIHADGEDDMAYNRKLNQLINDYNHDIQAITGQADDVRFFVEQAQWEATHGPTAVDQEYQEVHRDSEPLFPNGGRAYLVGPRYPVRCPFHYSPDGIRTQGARFAHAMDQVLFGGNDWEPTSPRDIRVSGPFVDIDFHVPNGRLQAGTTPNLGAIPADLGFIISNDAGSNMVESVTFLDADTLRLNCSADPTGRIVRYARDKLAHGEVQRGYVCDSDPQPTFYKRADGTDYDARNFSIAFEHEIPWTEIESTAGEAVAFQPSAADADLDGIPDTWEVARFGDLLSADGVTDHDGDGLPDVIEFEAGTNPLDPSDAPRLTLHWVSGETTPLRVTWPAVPGGHYVLESSEDLRLWSRLPGVYEATGLSLEATVDPAVLGAAGRTFLRVTVGNARER